MTFHNLLNDKHVLNKLKYKFGILEDVSNFNNFIEVYKFNKYCKNKLLYQCLNIAINNKDWILAKYIISLNPNYSSVPRLWNKKDKDEWLHRFRVVSYSALVISTDEYGNIVFKYKNFEWNQNKFLNMNFVFRSGHKVPDKDFFDMINEAYNQVMINKIKQEIKDGNISNRLRSRKSIKYTQ
jgi:hypothetical protein